MTPNVDLHSMAADLVAEQDDLDDMVAGIEDHHWRLPTASLGWTVADQVSHLAYFDGMGSLAITDPEAFVVHRSNLMELLQADREAADRHTMDRFRAMAPAEVLEAWRADRHRLAAAVRTLSDQDRVEWYGPSMSAKSFITARLMETWAHGQDVADAVRAANIRINRRPTARLRHVAQLGVITRGWSYVVRGMDPPEGPVRVDLYGPSGESWRWGPHDAVDVISGPAEDFCLVVTQRRHPDDTALRVEGDLAQDWLAHAQAFAGAATLGPPARSQPGSR